MRRTEIDAAPRGGFRFLVSSREWLAATFLIALAWAVELFFFQEQTLTPDWILEPRAALAARLLRFSLNVSFCLFFVALLQRRGLHCLFICGLISVVGLHTYRGYFGHALSFNTLIHQSAEGGAVFSYALSLVSWPFLVASVTLLAFKAFVTESRMGAQVARPARMVLAVAAGASYLVVFAFANLVLDPLAKFRIHGTIDRMGVTYGYLPSWLGEAWYLHQDTLLDRALEAAEHGTNRLAPIEASLDLPGNMVIIQVESLGADLLGLTHDGSLVMPFLTRLSDAAMLYRVRAVHTNGSADSDFVMLTGRMPSPDVITYKVRDYAYDRTLPAVSRQLGFKTVSMHGNTGAFFNRRSVFERMGFDRILFREELEQLLGRSYPHGGVEGVKDVDVFDVATRYLGEHRGERTLCFIITLTSHAPFSQLEPAEMELFPEPSNGTERYLNSMRYVDRALERFVGRLEPHTTVVLYGDHGVPELPQADPEVVPFLIFQPGRNLASSQSTRNLPLARSAELTLQDTALYIWHQLAMLADPAEEGPLVRLTQSSEPPLAPKDTSAGRRSP